MKKDWRLWKLLKGNESGIRWDYNLGTLDCSKEWWKMKIQVSLFSLFSWHFIMLSNMLIRIFFLCELGKQRIQKISQ
jgi:hypothetical protein